MFHEPLIRPLAELERVALVDALIKCRGDKVRVAAALGISLRTVYRRLDAYGMPLDYGRPVVNKSIDATASNGLTVIGMR